MHHIDDHIQFSPDTPHKARFEARLASLIAHDAYQRDVPLQQILDALFLAAVNVEVTGALALETYEQYLDLVLEDQLKTALCTTPDEIPNAEVDRWWKNDQFGQLLAELYGVEADANYRENERLFH